ncbi:hypothetical protein ACKWTF_010171 [Chironomus riparius]
MSLDFKFAQRSKIIPSRNKICLRSEQKNSHSHPKTDPFLKANENCKQPPIVMSYCSNIILSHIKSFEINTNICTHAAHIKENIHFSIFHKLAPCIILSAKNYRVLRTRKPQK